MYFNRFNAGINTALIISISVSHHISIFFINAIALDKLQKNFRAGLSTVALINGSVGAVGNFLEKNIMLFKLLLHRVVKNIQLLLLELTPSNSGLIGDDKKLVAPVSQSRQHRKSLWIELEIFYIMHIVRVDDESIISIKKNCFHMAYLNKISELSHLFAPG